MFLPNLGLFLIKDKYRVSLDALFDKSLTMCLKMALKQDGLASFSQMLGFSGVLPCPAFFFYLKKIVLR